MKDTEQVTKYYSKVTIFKYCLLLFFVLEFAHL